MDSHKWRRELDYVSEMKGMLISLNPSIEEQVDRQVRHLYDVFAEFTKAEKDLNDAGFLSKRKLQSKLEQTGSELEEDFMTLIRDFADLFRKEQRSIMNIMPKLNEVKPEKAKELAELSFPSMGAGDSADAEKLRSFGEKFSKMYGSLRHEISRDTKDLLDENKRIVETYERHITIDRSEVASTISNETVENRSISELISLFEKLGDERTYLDGRKGEVGRMIAASLMSDVESLQASVETAGRLGLELPIDFSQKLRILARDSSQASDLTTLLTLENQLNTARMQMANMLRDKIINMKHEVTNRIVEGGIPTTAEIIPQAPMLDVENQDVSTLLSSYQKMLEWEGQVRISLKDEVEQAVDDVERAVENPKDSGIVDKTSVKDFVERSKQELKDADVDTMIRVYLRAKAIREDARKHIREEIRSYIERFKELASSADRVLDYAQLSKKAPKLEDIDGGVVYLLQSLDSLRNAVDSGVATFRDACLQELDAIVEDLQTIKPQYAEIFMPIIVELEDAKSGLKKLNDFSAIRSEMRSIKEGILVKAKESLENLRYRLRVKIRLAAAKLMGAGVEIPGDVQEAISELNNVGVAAENVFSLPAIARKMIELYEKRISDEVIESLMKEVTQLEESLNRAKSIGVDVGKELEALGNIKANPPSELEEAAESFDILVNITTSPDLHKKIRTRADEAYSQIKGAVSLFEDRGMSDFVARLKGLIEQVPNQLDDDTKHVNKALEVCLTLANIQDEMLTVIKSIANKDAEQFQTDLKDKSKYISTIERVFEKHPKDFSKLIYPLDEMDKLESKLDGAQSLDVALKSFNELSELREGWLQKAEKMDDWHKSLKMFMAGFSPSSSTDARDKFIDEAIRKIKETYSREDISSYLSWAIREISQSMVEKRG